MKRHLLSHKKYSTYTSRYSLERNGNYVWFQVHSSAIFTLKSYAQALQLLGAMLPFTAIGIAHLYSKLNSRSGEIKSLRTTKVHRRQGIASKILEHIIKIFY
jgi:GNAT superfamily N-acetyltransferase